MLCNRLTIAESEVCNGHFSFQSVIDSWGIHSDENINSGTVLSYDAVCTGSPVIIMLQKSKQKEN